MKYAVIGGQYRDICYGVFDSLHAAKIAASKNIEFWDNFAGWHCPVIYNAKSVEFEDGECYVKAFHEPLYAKHNGRWCEFDKI